MITAWKGQKNRTFAQEFPKNMTEQAEIDLLTRQPTLVVREETDNLNQHIWQRYGIF